MESLEQHLKPYIVHSYQSKDIRGKIVEVAVYSLSPTDNKLRIIKFVSGVLKEFHTTEDKAEAQTMFEKLSQK